jgi:hypothetical protein
MIPASDGAVPTVAETPMAIPTLGSGAMEVVEGGPLPEEASIPGSFELVLASRRVRLVIFIILNSS